MLHRVRSDGGTKGGYRGPDRRSRQAAGGQIPQKELLAQSALLTLGALIPLAAVFVHGSGPVAAANSIQMMSSLATVGAGVALLVCWKIGGRATAGWLGIGFIDLGILATLYHNVSGLGVNPLGVVEPVGRLVLCIVVVGCILAALSTPEVDAKLRPLRALAFTALIGFGALAGLNRVFAGLPPLSQDVPLVQGTLFACAVLWLALGASAMISYRAHHAPTAGWTRWFILSRFCGSVVGALLVRYDWGAVFMYMAFLFSAAIALVASVWELRHAVHGQDRYALDLRTALHATQEDIERERAELDERLHDLRNAVTSMRYADSTLRTYASRLDDETRARLSEALSSELSRLQTLIEPGRDLLSEEFSLSEALTPLLLTERSRGSVIDAHIDSVRVKGDRDALSQVVQNLITNARTYAPGSAITFRAEHIADRVLLRIADDGPGIPEQERATIFQRGARGSTSVGTEGSGIGLYVASRLMRQMGGNLYLDETAGGACFVAELPAGSLLELAGNDRGDLVPALRKTTEHGPFDYELGL